MSTERIQAAHEQAAPKVGAAVLYPVRRPDADPAHPAFPPVGADGLMVDEPDDVYEWHAAKVVDIERHPNPDGPDAILAVLDPGDSPFGLSLSVALLRPNAGPESP